MKNRPLGEVADDDLFKIAAVDVVTAVGALALYGHFSLLRYLVRHAQGRGKPFHEIS